MREAQRRAIVEAIAQAASPRPVTGGGRTGPVLRIAIRGEPGERGEIDEILATARERARHRVVDQPSWSPYVSNPTGDWFVELALHPYDVPMPAEGSKKCNTLVEMVSYMAGKGPMPVREIRDVLVDRLGENGADLTTENNVTPLVPSRGWVGVLFECTGVTKEQYTTPMGATVRTGCQLWRLTWFAPEIVRLWGWATPFEVPRGELPSADAVKDTAAVMKCRSLMRACDDALVVHLHRDGWQPTEADAQVARDALLDRDVDIADWRVFPESVGGVIRLSERENRAP